jgi:hypothetical protein
MEEAYEILVDKDINCIVTETHQRRNQNPKKKDLDARTVSRIKRDAKIKAKRFQTITAARKKACLDPRMTYSMWVMLLAFITTLWNVMKWNWGATQFLCKPAGTGALTCVVEDEDTKTPVTAVADNSLNLCVKWMHMGSAAGEVIPLVILIAAKEMDAAACEIIPINGLAYNGAVGQTGYLVFTKTRAGNAAFFRWFALTIVAPTINDSQDFHEAKNDDGTPMRAWVTFDREAIVLPVMMEQEVLDVFAVAGIDLGKIAASCSGIHQASDVALLFMAVKKRLLTLQKKLLDVSDIALEKKIKYAITLLETKHSEVSVSPDMRKKIVFSILSVVAAIKDVFKPRLVAEGFAATGQHVPECSGSEDNTVSLGISFEKVMSRCFTDFSPQELRHMREQAPAHAKIMQETGYLTEEQMDAAHIPNIVDVTNSVPRDQRPVQNNRALILLHIETVKR